MTRPFNFCAGPAALPEPVLARASQEMLDWHGTGMSFMEMSHRSSEVVDTVAAAEAALRIAAGDYGMEEFQGLVNMPLTERGGLKLIHGSRPGAEALHFKAPHLSHRV